LLGDLTIKDILLIKAYDLVNSQEAIVNINIKDFLDVSHDLRHQYPNTVAFEAFQPLSLNFWAKNLRLITIIQSSDKQSLSLIIDKTAVINLMIHEMDQSLAKLHSSGNPVTTLPSIDVNNDTPENESRKDEHEVNLNQLPSSESKVGNDDRGLLSASNSGYDGMVINMYICI
jgi:hypothetical protein